LIQRRRGLGYLDAAGGGYDQRVVNQFNLGLEL